MKRRHGATRRPTQIPCRLSVSTSAPAMSAVGSHSSGAENAAIVRRRDASLKGNMRALYVGMCVFIALATAAHLVAFRRALAGNEPRYLALRGGDGVIRSGDLLLFGGTHLDAALIRAWTMAPLSHVGLALVARRKHTTRLFVYNCDADPQSHCYLRDACVDSERGGVMLNDFVVKCATYRGAVFHCPLRRRLSVAQLDAWQRTVLPRFRDTRFRFHTSAMLHAAYPNAVPLLSTDDDALLCTELVALVYRALGVVSVPVAGQVSPQRLVDRLDALGVVEMRATRVLKRAGGGDA